MRSFPHDDPPVFSPRLPRSFFVKLIVLIVILFLGFQAISVYVDSLWFSSLGFESVYWYQLKAQSSAFVAFFAASFFILWLMFSLVVPSSRGVRRPLMEFNGRPVFLPGLETVRNLIRPAAAVIGLLIGIAFSSEWMTLARYLNRVDLGGPPDPIFARPLAFYLFTIPALEVIGGWLLALAVVVMIAAMLLAVADATAKFRGVSISLAFLLAVIALQTFISRYNLLTEDHTLFSGINYVGDKILAPGLLLTAVALIVGSVIALVNISVGRISNLIVAIGIPAATYVVAGVIVPTYVTNFVVRPNELVRETPYIRNNIQFTRRAFDLDRVEDVPFEPRLTNATFDPSAHQTTLDNIRLWDWRALQDTLRQIQEIRTYYDFPDVDVDRYTIGGKQTAVMLAARELSLSKLPSGSQNWVNERLIYTHGFGVTMNPVSQFTPEGLPKFILSNMPVESTSSDIQVKRPEIYFGELTDWPVYVKTRQKEFNYPEGDANNYTTYSGSGGIRMGSFFRRLLLASQISGDITKVPFSDDITADSVLLLRRNIIDRAGTIAPFLTLDNDPYLVVGADGALYWFIDAYTTSDEYPYSRHFPLQNGDINYIRNSVKIVVDAYNGTVSFYVFDTTDPLIQSYQKMFPALFKPASEMPDFLRRHVRYPEVLLRVQAQMYATYHVENEQVFYNHEDIWTVAQQGRSQSGAQEAQDAIEPFFILMSFPGDSRLEFVSILPFTPASRNNLIGWVGARSDGGEYGRLRAYHFPKTRFVDGPLQIQARIDQNSQLSSQLTLWNQQGSKVIRGNLLVIPLNDTILFAEPIYLQAERSPMPELRLVVLATQDRLAYATTFPDALKALLEGRSEAPVISSSNSTSATTTAGAQQPTSDVRTLIERANQALADYRRLTADGKLGEAGTKLDELKRTLEELNRLQPK
jgi:uncharacterized membrane protein (UPF0182 family)